MKSQHFTDEYLPGIDFDRGVWNEFLMLLISVFVFQIIRKNFVSFVLLVVLYYHEDHEAHEIWLIPV